MNVLRKAFRGCWHLLWACVPGCGQMCQGYMKRGISQTMMFGGLAFIAVFLEMGALAVLIAPLWLYSFFDSFNLRRQIRDGMAPGDEFMFGLSEMDSRKLTEIINRRGSLIGWVLVAVGLYNVYQIFARRLLGTLRDYFPIFDWLYGLLVWDMPRILGTVLIIALGLWFIKGPKTPKAPKEDEPVYAPPKGPGAPPRMNATPWTQAEETFHQQPDPQAPEVPEVEEPEEPTPVTLEWKSEFHVEKYEKELQERQEADHDGQ